MSQSNRNAQLTTIKPAGGDVLPVGELMERIIAAGDVSQLTPGDRAHYLVRVAESSGLNPLTRPFDLIPGQGGKLVLYANKGATDQLRKLYGLNARLISQETINGVRVVTVEVTDGVRSEVNIGAVDISKAQGDGLANALMKAITKAKRRATLDWCGLGLLDETEIEGLRAALDEQRQHAGGHIEAVHRPAETPSDDAGDDRSPVGALGVQMEDGRLVDAETGDIEPETEPEPETAATIKREIMALAAQYELKPSDMKAIADGLGSPSWNAMNLEQSRAYRDELVRRVTPVEVAARHEASTASDDPEQGDLPIDAEYADLGEPGADRHTA